MSGLQRVSATKAQRHLDDLGPYDELTRTGKVLASLNFTVVELTKKLEAYENDEYPPCEVCSGVFHQHDVHPNHRAAAGTPRAPS